MLKEYKVDLHIHTSLSPCGDKGMLPPLIVKRALEMGLDMIGICDHNSSENVRAVAVAANGSGLFTVGGMEVTSREEAHVLALFGDGESLEEMQRAVYESLSGFNDEKSFGVQLVVDARGNVLGKNQRLLIGATGFSVDDIVSIAHELGGLAIASHVDRQMFSVISQLGFIPDYVHFDALEISPGWRIGVNDSWPVELAYARFHFPLVSFSDAHYPEDIGKSFTYALMEEINFDELKKAIRGKSERKVHL